MPQRARSDQTPPLVAVVATIGPASESPDVVCRLIDNGVRVFRFNFSHGTLEDHARRLSTVRSAASALGRQIACLGDLQGPKIRVGTIPSAVGEPSRSGGGAIRVEPGQDVIFKRDIDVAVIRTGSHGPEPVLPITYPELVSEVEPGHKVLINDGAVRMLAVERLKPSGELRCRVTVGGLITSGKGINLPQSDLSAPALSERDLECLAWGVAQEMDYIALSFVRRAQEIVDLRARIEAMPDPARPGCPAWVPIVAKIEKPQAVADLGAIVDEADAVMVARGDLGVEMDIARVPVVQKEILAACDRAGKPCIVATQMLETMIENPSPTRAEASDVANAVFDGADAVMLSGETAAGKHPALVVETMCRIVSAAEAYQRRQHRPPSPPSRYTASHQSTAALAAGAWSVARDIGAKAVVCWSQQGGTARYLSQTGFDVPIVAYSSDPRATRRMALLRGVWPVCEPAPASGRLSDWNQRADAELLERGLAQPGDPIVLVAGRPLGQAKATNTIAIHRVGEPTGAYRGQ